MKKILLILLTIFLTSGIWSCGARKTNKTEITETVKKDSVSKMKEVVVSESELNKNNDVSEDNFTIEPVELDKPIEITDSSGKTTVYKNARIRREIKTDRSIVLKQNKITAVMENEVRESVISKMEHTEKKTERESGFNLWWLLVPAGLIVLVYLCYRKYKDCCVGLV